MLMKKILKIEKTLSGKNRKILKQIRAIAEKQRLLNEKLRLDLIKMENDKYQKN